MSNRRFLIPAIIILSLTTVLFSLSLLVGGISEVPTLFEPLQSFGSFFNNSFSWAVWFIPAFLFLNILLLIMEKFQARYAILLSVLSVPFVTVTFLIRLLSGILPSKIMTMMINRVGVKESAVLVLVVLAVEVVALIWISARFMLTPGSRESRTGEPLSTPTSQSREDRSASASSSSVIQLLPPDLKADLDEDDWEKEDYEDKQDILNSDEPYYPELKDKLKDKLKEELNEELIDEIMDHDQEDEYSPSVQPAIILESREAEAAELQKNASSEDSAPVKESGKPAKVKSEPVKLTRKSEAWLDPYQGDSESSVMVKTDPGLIEEAETAEEEIIEELDDVSSEAVPVESLEDHLEALPDLDEELVSEDVPAPRPQSVQPVQEAMKPEKPSQRAPGVHKPHKAVPMTGTGQAPPPTDFYYSPEDIDLPLGADADYYEEEDNTPSPRNDQPSSPSSRIDELFEEPEYEDGMIDLRPEPEIEAADFDRRALSSSAVLKEDFHSSEGEEPELSEVSEISSDDDLPEHLEDTIEMDETDDLEELEETDAELSELSDASDSDDIPELEEVEIADIEIEELELEEIEVEEVEVEDSGQLTVVEADSLAEDIEPAEIEIEDEEDEEDGEDDEELDEDPGHSRNSGSKRVLEEAMQQPKPKPLLKKYEIPADGILEPYTDGDYWIVDEETKRSGDVLRETLEEFKISAEVTGIRKGPVVTMFEILPAPGVKLSKITNLADNIALRLAASRVRIVAPIPGKHAVGIEVPNKKRSLVSFKEMIESDTYKESKMAIPVILGKDITGGTQMVDLAQTPHLLIAGATGSGKSVCVNDLICSVLYKRSHNEVKMILIDPKIVELKLYNDIPHLLTPVITEPKKAFQALQYCLCEMERRYSLLDALAVRDIKSYNKRIKERKMTAPELPYIMVIVDEFADLMATTGKELEATLARLAAMSRAVGIHLVLATQRPSIDVITGLIKANIPSRIAFMVASKFDSRIILDAVGAEKLLGKGDMLFTSAWSPHPTRIQGAFLSEEEVEKIVAHVKTFGEPDYIDDEIFVDEDEEASESLFAGSDADPLMNRAIEIVSTAGKASASYLQRRLKIGYNRAARLVEEMELRGIVGPQNGSKPREVLNYSADL